MIITGAIFLPSSFQHFNGCAKAEAERTKTSTTPRWYRAPPAEKKYKISFFFYQHTPYGLGGWVKMLIKGNSIHLRNKAAAAAAAAAGCHGDAGSWARRHRSAGPFRSRRRLRHQWLNTSGTTLLMLWIMQKGKLLQMEKMLLFSTGRNRRVSLLALPNFVGFGSIKKNLPA